jgi:peptidoglycan/LPS O-acetylase OafA/YrhL
MASGRIQRTTAGLFAPEPIEARTWPGLNGVRGLAALSVFVIHAVGTNRVSHAGFSGVTVFFVLSGFLLAHLWIHEEDTHDGAIDHRRYFRKRFGRVAPVLFVYVFFATIIMGVTLAGATGEPDHRAGR